MRIETKTAWVRALSPRYADCLREGSAPIDVAAARHQHAGYVAALEAAGVDVQWLEALDDAPDSVFVEDTAVILGDLSVLTRPGAPARRAELASVEPRLLGRGRVFSVQGPATLDGGDVLHTGDRLFVGLSARTNPEGAAALAVAARSVGLSVVNVPLRAGLHLKSACALLAPGTIVYFPADLDPAPFLAAGLECLAVPERAGANVLALGDVVLVSAAAPMTRALLTDRGIRTVPLDLDEIHKGDGALTCLSLRFAGADAFAT